MTETVSFDKKEIERVVREVMQELFPRREQTPSAAAASVAAAPPIKEQPAPVDAIADEDLVDICSMEMRQRVLIANPADAEMMERMRQLTNARIGAGRAGARLNTVTMLTLRANHATARDSVFQEVDPALLEEMGLFSVRTQCNDKNTYLTRPDLGRKLCPEARKLLAEKCKKSPRVQVYVSDGLSSKAIEANVRNILPALFAGLESYGINHGTPFFVEFGRVGVMDEISELLDAEVCCVLIGERPGLSTAESMSAYITYRGTVGMPEARRTVVSNIHSDGINSVEAGAYIADIIRIMLEKKCSGVDLSL